jgi:hypothetical protein
MIKEYIKSPLPKCMFNKKKTVSSCSLFLYAWPLCFFLSSCRRQPPSTPSLSIVASSSPLISARVVTPIIPAPSRRRSQKLIHRQNLHLVLSVLYVMLSRPPFKPPSLCVFNPLKFDITLCNFNNRVFEIKLEILSKKHHYFN